MTDDTKEAQAVPHGWKLVPVEPTQEMLLAANDVTRSDWSDPIAHFRSHYMAMVASAPDPKAGSAADMLHCKGHQMMTTNTEQLKPCPFCGGTEQEYDNCDYGSGEWYTCLGCGVQVKVSYGVDLNAAWNKRAQPAVAQLTQDQIDGMDDTADYVQQK